MTKPLLIVSIVLSLAAAVLGFLNRGKLTTTLSELENVNGQLAAKTQQLEAATKEVEEKKQEVTTLSAERDTLNAKLGEAQTDLTKAKEEATAATAKATTAETELAQAKADAEAKDVRIAELEQQGTSTAAAPIDANVEVTELKARITELETVNKGLEDQNAGLTAQSTELRNKEQQRQKLLVRPGLQGTVLAVNQAWNFVVLSLGDRQGVLPNTEMLVQRGTQYLGKVRVTTVEPSTSIADIVVKTVPRGLTVMPGDTVIYQSQRD